MPLAPHGVSLQEAHAIALERLKIELTGTYNEREALRSEQEKEARVELLRRQIGRRMMNQGLVRGWSAWLEMWEAKVWQRSLLRQAANRLKLPELSAVFKRWHHDMTKHQREETSRKSRRAHSQTAILPHSHATATPQPRNRIEDPSRSRTVLA